MKMFSWNAYFGTNAMSQYGAVFHKTTSLQPSVSSGIADTTRLSAHLPGFVLLFHLSFRCNHVNRGTTDSPHINI